MAAFIDSHVHVWQPQRADYPWLADVPELDRPFELADVLESQAAVQVAGVVLVQAADNVADTANMFRTASAHDEVAGVVVWVPLLDPAAAESLLERWSDEPVVGARHLVHRDPDPDLLRRRAVHETLDLLGDRGLTFDVCAETPELLALVPEVAARHTRTTFVVDHLGKPPIRQRGWEPWASLLAVAADSPNVVAKVSGLNTAAGPGWTSADFAPYVDHALTLFAPDRLMYGGDWPFALLAADSYRQIWDGIHGTLASLSSTDQQAVYGETARRVYGLTPTSPDDLDLVE